MRGSNIYLVYLRKCRDNASETTPATHNYETDRSTTLTRHGSICTRVNVSSMRCCSTSASASVGCTRPLRRVYRKQLFCLFPIAPRLDRDFSKSRLLPKTILSLNAIGTRRKSCLCTTVALPVSRGCCATSRTVLEVALQTNTPTLLHMRTTLRRRCAVLYHQLQNLNLIQSRLS